MRGLTRLRAQSAGPSEGLLSAWAGAGAAPGQSAGEDFDDHSSEVSGEAQVRGRATDLSLKEGRSWNRVRGGRQPGRRRAWLQALLWRSARHGWMVCHDDGDGCIGFDSGHGVQVASDLLVLTVNADPVDNVMMMWEELKSLTRISRTTLEWILFRFEEIRFYSLVVVVVWVWIGGDL